ncbi:uncharacterized protein LOC144438185 isoform X2 [Glandiceps talaboti]
MPSECMDTFGSDSVGYEDLNSPDSLYPAKESMNSLLPKELRIPENKGQIKIEPLEALNSNDRSLEANHDQSSYLSLTTANTTFPAFENNQHGLGALDSIDLAQGKGLGVSNTVVSFPLLSNISEVQESLFQFPELSEMSTPSTAVTSPAPSSCDEYLSQSALESLDEDSMQSFQELMSLGTEESLASAADLLEVEQPRKARKNTEDQSPSSPSSVGSPISVFDADGATSSPRNFNFSENPDTRTEDSKCGGVPPFGYLSDDCIQSMLSDKHSKNQTSNKIKSSNLSEFAGCPSVAVSKSDGGDNGGESDFCWDLLFSSIYRSNQELPMETSGPHTPIKEPSLNMTFPSKENGIELKILIQPESHHRARYQTEGSRGCVKDESQNGFPTVKLLGLKEKVNLQVFVGTDSGKIKPHGFYQASKVSGRNNTPCEEKIIDSTSVIEMQMDPAEDMTTSIDCVGIMKLRNADVEHKGLGVPRSKKRSTRARLVFRVNIPKSDGTYRTLQIASNQISCTQPTGLPEVTKKSISSCSVKGGEELFILGKNFVRGTAVKFQQYLGEKLLWEEKAQIDREHFQQNHLVCTIPAFKSQDISEPVEISVIVTTGNGRESDPQPFSYTPIAATTPSPVAVADSSVKVKAEQTEARTCLLSSPSTKATEIVGSCGEVLNQVEVVTQLQKDREQNQSSFAEQLKLVALLATGQNKKAGNSVFAQRVLSVINQHKAQQHHLQQEALLKQQQSYLGDRTTMDANDADSADTEAALNQLIAQGAVDYDLDEILDTLQQAASTVVNYSEYDEVTAEGTCTPSLA